MIAVISWRQLSADQGVLAGAGGAWQSRTIAKDGSFNIGRARGSFICLEDIRVSRQHVSVERAGERIHIMDHGSANGAFLDGKPFERAVWSPGQRLQIADFEFQISFQPAAAVVPSGGEPPSPKAKPSSRSDRRLAGGGPLPPVAGGIDDEAYAAAQALIAEARRGRAPMGGEQAVMPATVRPEASAVRRDTLPSSRAQFAPPSMLMPLAWGAQVLLLATIVLTSMVLTVRVILLSVASKSSAVEDKAKDVLSIFGVELSNILDEDGETGSTFANAVDPWSFAWDIDAYRGLVIGTMVVYGLCALVFIAWHAAVDRAVPFGNGSGLFHRVMNGPLAWFVPVIHLIQPPRVIGRLYEVVTAVDPVGSGPWGRRMVVWLWWVLLIAGGALMLAGQMEAPETLDTFGVVTIAVAPLLVIMSAACAVVLVRDLSDRIMRAAKPRADG
ncbi:MAG: FHA domain-containing protein [Pseudomonadota bacterium]